MSSFLSDVITQELSQKKGSLHQYIFVLPSQRAGVFLKKELLSQLDETTFLPQIISIENFIQELAGINHVDAVQLLFEFYSIYKENTLQKEQDEFEVFSQWASIVLQDFNEIDGHLINSNDLFLYLRDINRLKNWSPSTTLTKNYFSFFENLHLYYEEFYKYLKSKNIGYQGLIYREAESNIHHYIESNHDTKLVLIGFNALNRAEENIFQELLESGLATIYWDAEERYLTETNETGMFLRKYKKEWAYFQNNSFNWSKSYESIQDKNVEFIGVAKNVGQLKQVGELIEENTDLSNTAIVLADESLLSLTLNSLPNNVEKINVTMGFPLKDIPLTSFFDTLIKLYLNQERLGVSEKNLFYYKDVMEFCNHAYFKKLLKGRFGFINTEIGKSNQIFVSEEFILNMLSQVESPTSINVLFKKESLTVKNVIENCIQICNSLKNYVVGVEKEYAYRFFTIFQQLQTLNTKFGHIKNLKTLNQFLYQLVNNEKLSFQGEPLQGLQLMGMLETRVIDFETVIVTSVNEGILPVSKSDQSFIPFDVKKHFNMPTYQEKDAIFSYHFYRLLHRAKNVYLIYNTENDVFGTGEKSRFLTQLEINNPSIKHSIVSPKVTVLKKEPKVIIKSNELILTLNELGQKGMSPSALATYIYNPIDFYYQKILRIKEVENVEETVAVNTMGTVIHATLEQLYKPFINSILVEDSIKTMSGMVNQLIDLNFQKEYKNGDITKGKNKLVFEVSKKLVQRFLAKELDEIKQGKKIEIIALEEELFADLKIQEIDFPIKLRGIIDRIDKVDGVMRILDYKSGMVQSAQLKMSDFGKMSSDYKHTKALQVMMYAFLYSENNEIDFSKPIEAGIISLKNLNSGFLKMNFAEKNGKDFDLNASRMNEFMDELKKIIAEIFNPDIPFVENLERKY